MQINVTAEELAVFAKMTAAGLAAELRPEFHKIIQEIMTMSGTLEDRLQAAQAAQSAALNQIATDLTALAARLVPGATITEADVAMAEGIAQAAAAAQTQADALAAPPAPPTP